MEQEKRPQGRPRKNYKAFYVKLPPDICALTSATAKAHNITQAELWVDALAQYIKNNPIPQ